LIISWISTVKYRPDSLGHRIDHQYPGFPSPEGIPSFQPTRPHNDSSRSRSAATPHLALANSVGAEHSSYPLMENSKLSPDGIVKPSPATIIKKD
jgi:hypothetical protein